MVTGKLLTTFSVFLLMMLLSACGTQNVAIEKVDEKAPNKDAPFKKQTVEKLYSQTRFSR